MSPKRRRKPLLGGDQLGALVIDSGGLSASATDPEVLAMVRTFVARGWPAVTPIPVLAETIQGNARDAVVNRVLTADIDLVPCDEATSRQAGALRTVAMRTASPSGIDAIVAATAVTAGTAVIMTNDPNDLEALTTRHSDVRVLPV